MAGLGRRTFAPGEVLTASNVMNYLMDQSVMSFAGTAARGSAIGTAVSEGMVTYLADTNSVEVYTGSAWNPISQIQSPNVIINGGFDIWQRGTSSGWANAYTTADRWFTNASASTSWAQDSTNIAGGCRFSIKATVGSGASSDPIILQAIETSNVLPMVGKTVTLSAFVSTSSSSSIRLTVEWSANTDNALTGTWTNIQTQTFTSTTSLTRYSMTVAVPSTARSLRVVVGANGNIPANATMNVTGVQLEVGDVATPFRRNANSIQGELAACQRYFYRVPGFANATGAAINTAGDFIVRYLLPVEMRTSPSLAISAGTFTWSDDYIADGSGTYSDAAYYSVWGNRNVRVQINTTGSSTTGRWYSFGNYNALGTSNADFSAEL